MWVISILSLSKLRFSPSSLTILAKKRCILIQPRDGFGGPNIDSERFLRMLSGTGNFIFVKMNQKFELVLEFTPHFPKNVQKPRKHKFTPHFALKSLRNDHFCVLPPFDFGGFEKCRWAEHRFCTAFENVFWHRKNHLLPSSLAIFCKVCFCFCCQQKKKRYRVCQSG